MRKTQIENRTKKSQEVPIKNLFLKKKGIKVGGLLVFILSLIIMFVGFSYKQELKAKEQLLLEIRQETQELSKELVNTQKQLSEKSLLQKIEQELSEARGNKIELLSEKIEAEKKYNSNIWFIRCLEIQGELEIKNIEIDLACENKNYKQLESYDTYNVQSTRQSLGLK